VDQTKPFSLAKDPAQAKRLDEVLYNLAETCRVLAVLLWPFLPGTSVKIYAQLGLTGAPDTFSEAAWGGLKPGHKIGEPRRFFRAKTTRNREFARRQLLGNSSMFHEMKSRRRMRIET